MYLTSYNIVLLIDRRFNEQSKKKKNKKLPFFVDRFPFVTVIDNDNTYKTLKYIRDILLHGYIDMSREETRHRETGTYIKRQQNTITFIGLGTNNRVRNNVTIGYLSLLYVRSTIVRFYNNNNNNKASTEIFFGFFFFLTIYNGP